MANLNSTLYTNLFVNKYLADARDKGTRITALPFSHTVGADVNGDTVNLTVIPANWMVIGLDVSNDAMGASTTVSLGDAGSATRYLAATSVTSAGRNNGLLSAGQNFRTTADTILLATWGGANPTAAAVLKGVLYCIAPE